MLFFNLVNQVSMVLYVEPLRRAKLRRLSAIRSDILDTLQAMSIEALTENGAPHRSVFIKDICLINAYNTQRMTEQEIIDRLSEVYRDFIDAEFPEAKVDLATLDSDAILDMGAVPYLPNSPLLLFPYYFKQVVIPTTLVYATSLIKSDIEYPLPVQLSNLTPKDLNPISNLFNYVYIHNSGDASSVKDSLGIVN